ncbi:MAG: glutamate--cysteine ligase [Burkholderiales bacterium]|nr:glutamate--cysteine ligase [Burkholderiales bacterium]
MEPLVESGNAPPTAADTAGETLEFKQSAPLSMGVELELQLVETRGCDLTRAASDLIELVERRPHPGEVKPEITESMIEVATGVHHRYDALAAELAAIRDALGAAAERLNVLVCGGGAHPFQHWPERQIYDRPRFRHLSDLYGYLAKQFTVFGQHIHIGCPHGDDALYLVHALARYVPHFVAFAASSPYSQGTDTQFESARLNAVSAFPLSGRAPFVLRWSEFNEYFAKMRRLGIVESMKDFYWDIRPKPEFGTVEIRVCDTPLTAERAGAIAAYAQTIARYLLIERPVQLTEDLLLTYSYNRFQSCRFAFDGDFIDPVSQKHSSLRDEIAATMERLEPHARELETEEPLAALAAVARENASDARWMRSRYQLTGSLHDLVWQQCRRWRGEV